MDFEKTAIEDLKNYEKRKISLQNNLEELKALKLKADGMRSVASNPGAVKGGGNVYELALIDNIDRRNRLERNVELAKTFVRRIDRALEQLTENERTVLQYFYINRTHNYINDLCDKLNVERATVYRIKNEAIYNFTIALYGYIDI